MQILNRNSYWLKLIHVFTTAYLKKASVEPRTSKCSQKQNLTFEERRFSDSSVTGRFSPRFISSSSGAVSFCTTGDPFFLYVLSRFGLALEDSILMSCPGFRALSLPSWEVSFSVLINLKQNKQILKKYTFYFGWERRKALLHLHFELTHMRLSDCFD